MVILNMEFDNKLIEKLKNEGKVVVPNLIAKDDLNIYKNIINKYKAFSKTSAFTLPVSKSYLAVKLVKLQIDKIFYILKLTKMAKDLNLKSCSDKVFDEKTKLYIIDLYMSQKSNNPVLPWHCDQTYIPSYNYLDKLHGKAGKQMDYLKYSHPNEGFLKFFFYLTDVDSNNGCLGYIPKSHILIYYLKICFYKKELKFEPYFTLSDIRNLPSKDYVRDKINKYINNETIDEFIDNTKFVEEGNKDTFKHDIKVNAGDLLIFNELGYHRGSSPTKNDRYALRYNYIRQSYDVNWYKKIKR